MECSFQNWFLLWNYLSYMYIYMVLCLVKRSVGHIAHLSSLTNSLKATLSFNFILIHIWIISKVTTEIVHNRPSGSGEEFSTYITVQLLNYYCIGCTRVCSFAQFKSMNLPIFGNPRVILFDSFSTLERKLADSNPWVATI